METVDKVHPWHWAKENLSEPRARAFWKAYREIEQGRFSDEYYKESRAKDEIRYAFIRANSEQINAITAKAEQEAEELEKQANLLLNQASKLRSDARDEVSRIQSGVYQTEEFKAQQEKVSEIWKRDDALAQPKIEALIEKYRKAQEASK